MILSVKNLSVRRSRELVLDAVGFDLAPQKIVGLTGPNGGGKTTLFEVLMGWRRAYVGEIAWSAGATRAYLPQQLSPRQSLPLTVKEFISMGTWGLNSKSGSALSVEDAIQELQLSALEKNLISDLSGGEWKRTTLARCLVQPADIYLLDEPFNHVDVSTEDRIGHLLRDLVRHKQKTFFIISHDWHAMDHHFDDVILLSKRIIARGDVRTVSEISFNWKDPKHHAWMHP